jgi:hypothetical protein
MISWWFLWLAFMFMFLVPPLGYGWGYRGWGPPLPRYVQRRRGPPVAGGTGAPTPPHLAWGRGGDFVWMIFGIGMMWMVVAMWFPFWQR